MEELKPYGFIYITTNLINGKKYIGQKMYCRDWKYYLGSGKYFKLALKKYGRDNFDREIVEIASSKKQLNELEIKYIVKYNAVKNTNFYNVLIGGGGSPTAGTHYSDELKLKLSIAQTGRHEITPEIRQKISNSLKGEKNPNYGKKISEEQKMKLRKSRISYIVSTETRNKMSISHTGKFVSEETRLKISKIHKGKMVSDEVKQKIRDTLTKFNDKEVDEIRKIYAIGELSQAKLSKKYGTSQSVIWNIVNFKGPYKSKEQLALII